MTKSLFYTREIFPYRYGLVVSIGQTDAQLRASMQGLDRKLRTSHTEEVMLVAYKTNPEHTKGYVQNWQSDSLMRIYTFPKSIGQRGAIVHELLHVVRACLWSRSLKMKGVTGQEAYCYLLEDLYIDLFRRLK